MSKHLERLDRLRFVIMESPYDSWGHPRTEEVFAKMMTLKLRGYGKEYPYGVMAVDTTDMISDHLLVCEETDAGLRALVGNKSVPLSKCEQFHLPWPGLSLLEDAKAHPHDEVMRGIIRDCKETGRDLRYAGSWTMDPAERGQGEWSTILRELFTAIYCSYYMSFPKVGVITGGTVRFKVPDYVKWLGHEGLALNGVELPPLNVTHLAGESVLWTYMTQVGFEPRQVVRKWQKLWDNQLRIPAQAPAIQPAVKRAA